jgi:valyl-tRNA synthetase
MIPKTTFLSLENKHYQHEEIEAKIYKLWEDSGCFNSSDESDKPSFSVVIPPPNVTGRLHMGHALNNVIQDVIVRFKRMDGFNVSWVPGTDHAGISTQSVVKKQLQADGINYRELGREETLKRIWEWKERFGNTILNQIKRLGCSCDWQRLAFTMDEKRSKAVLAAFIELYNAGLIYRGKRIVNWCVVDQTALSNDETYTNENGEPGHLWSVKYRLVNKSEPDSFVVIATTRPETILGDTAIAVNPNDERLKHLIGLKAIVPIVNREVPIVGDEYVDVEFGTGCLKVTPAHDPNDFEIALRHNLEFINIMNEDATLNSSVPSAYQGLDRFKAREKIVAELRELNALVKIEERNIPLVRAERSKEIIEYRLSDQWFVKTKPLAHAALESFACKELEFFPKRWGGVYQSWLENIKDWCISRQIWWGHRIPAWHNSKTGEIVVANATPKVAEENPSDWYQDPDVLDTWFSSALWPFSTFGWPESEKSLEKFFPNSILVTGKDIISLWVARMTMSSLFHLKKSPFKTVVINSLITDEDGETMSKSKGNGIDPLHVLDGATTEELTATIYEARPRDMDRLLIRIQKLFPNGFTGVGADALRFSLLTLNSEAQQAAISLNRFAELGRPFNDKLWNACRFVLKHLENDIPTNSSSTLKLRLEDRYILARIDETVATVRDLMEQFKFSAAFDYIYKFFWDDVCDWYLEIVKFRLKGSDNDDIYTVKKTLAEVLSVVIRLLHPAVPFITEELWGHLYPRLCNFALIEDSSKNRMCATVSYPVANGRGISSEERESFLLLKDLITALRAKRLEFNIPKNSVLKVYYEKSAESTFNFFTNDERKAICQNLAGVEINLLEAKSPNHTTLILDRLELYLDLEAHRDLKGELAKYQKDRLALSERIAQLEKKLSNVDFTVKAPESVVLKEKAALELAKQQENLLEELEREVKSKI